MLVLEQHYIAGGCCHTFTEKGYEFDTGIHYVGNVKLNKILNPLVENEIKWTKLGNTWNDKSEVYDEIFIGNDSFKIRSSQNDFEKDLINRFPNEKKNIINYFKLINKVNNYKLFFIFKIIKNITIKKYLINFFCKDYLKYASQNAYDTIKNEITNNPDLIAILLGQHGDAATPPKKLSFIMHAGIVGHYLNGAYYPNGGPSKITRELINTINIHNGKVLVRKAVKKIIIDHNKAVGVEMENGDIIYSKNIISSCGYINTFQKLIDKNISENLKIMDYIDNYNPPLSYFYVFLGLKYSIDTFHMTSRNIWGHPSNNLDKDLINFCKDPINAPIPYFLAFPSDKDKDWNDRMPYKSTAVLLTMFPYDFFKKWKNQKCMYRDVEYKDLKNKLPRLVNEALLRHFPELKDKISYMTGHHHKSTLFGKSLW